MIIVCRLLQLVDVAERADWLHVLEREAATLKQCELFITVMRSNELCTPGEYAEVIQLEPTPASRLISKSDGLYMKMSPSITARRKLMFEHE